MSNAHDFAFTSLDGAVRIFRSIGLAFALLAIGAVAANAGGRYDGEWTGSAPGVGRMNACLGFFTATIKDNQLAGTAEFTGNRFQWSGTITGANFAGQFNGGKAITGTFDGDSFTGQFHSNCGPEAVLTLHRKR